MHENKLSSITRKHENLVETGENVTCNGVLQVPLENLPRLAMELERYIPHSLNVLGPIRCTENNQILYDFYVDQWPTVKHCVAVIRKEHFHRFQDQPYSVVLLFGCSDERESIAKLINVAIPNWNLSVIFLPGPNANQIATIADICSAHGTMYYQNQIFHMTFSTNKADIKLIPVPPDYEIFKLTTDNTDELAGNWAHTDAPFKVEDIRTLIERFCFLGIRCKADGKLVAHAGQFHNGSCGVGWVHPDHRGKKLFQDSALILTNTVVISHLFAEVIDCYGFAFGTVIDGNIASWKGNLAVGMRSKDGYDVHWGQFVPLGQTLPEIKYSHTEVGHH